jgi:signal transduction histidine kinase/CheY-like chemotaxis protein
MTRYSSLQWKLTALIVGGSVVTAIIAAAGFCWLDLQRAWQNTTSEVSVISNIVADQVGPAILLGDRKAAAEVLTSLGADELVQDAILYDAQGGCFAWYHRAPAARCAPEPREGIQRHGSSLLISRAVNAGTERIGGLSLVATVPSIASILRRFAGAAGLIIVVSLAVAGVAAAALQSRVSRPILGIAKMAEHIAATHRFEDRVAVDSSDELGVLAGSFNAMLDEIERRDAELARHRQRLETEVAERSRVNRELQRAKNKAEEATRLKSEFLANMSHEIRTPMNGVIGMISLALEQCDRPEERDQLAAAQMAANSLVAILNDILDLSKLEAGKMTLEAIDFNLRSAIRDSLRLFEIQAREKNLELSAEFAPECPTWVQGDPVRMRQIIVNLVGNAVKFTPSGSVRVQVAQVSPGAVQFLVKDTGIGIPHEKLHSIFDAFTQADGSHTRQFGGTGLGLTITRRLVDLMGGRLWAHSECGLGSEFYVDLPLGKRPEPVMNGGPKLPGAAKFPSGLHVLVAEDNAINQKVIQSMLRRQGWNVTLAVNGDQAYKRFLEKKFDLVLMDVQMPELDGLEATKLMRLEESRRNLVRTPILALTAHTAQSQHQQCLFSGMDGVITKPVTIPALLEAINPVLNVPVSATS